MTKPGKTLSESVKKNEMLKASSSGCDGKTQNHQIGDPCLKTVFQCPVKCEGSKTYNVSGNCPVCNKQLEQVSEVHQQYYL